MEKHTDIGACQLDLGLRDPYFEPSMMEYLPRKSFVMSTQPLPEQKRIRAHTTLETLLPKDVYTDIRRANIWWIVWDGSGAEDVFLPYLVSHLYAHKIVKASDIMDLSLSAYDRGIVLTRTLLKKVWNDRKNSTAKSAMAIKALAAHDHVDICPKFNLLADTLLYCNYMGSLVTFRGPQIAPLTFLPSYHYTNIVRNYICAHKYTLNGKTYEFMPGYNKLDKKLPQVTHIEDVTPLFFAKPTSTGFLWPPTLTRIVIPLFELYLTTDNPFFEWLKVYKNTVIYKHVFVSIKEATFDEYLDYTKIRTKEFYIYKGVAYNGNVIAFNPEDEEEEDFYDDDYSLYDLVVTYYGDISEEDMLSIYDELTVTDLAKLNPKMLALYKSFD